MSTIVTQAASSPCAQELTSWSNESFDPVSGRSLALDGALANRNEPSLTWALERIDQLVAQLEAEGFARDQIFLLGFSQGACLLAEYLSRIDFHEE